MSLLWWSIGIAIVLLAGGLYLADQRRKEARKGSGPVDNSVAEPSAEAPHAVGIERDLVPDDLTQIKGIGPVLEEKLNQIGIVSFEQLADLTPIDAQRINQQLDFPGRIERDRWVEQATALVGKGR